MQYYFYKVFKTIILDNPLDFKNILYRLSGIQKKRLILDIIDSRVEQKFLNFITKNNFKHFFSNKYFEVLLNSSNLRKVKNVENLAKSTQVFNEFRKNNITFAPLKGINLFYKEPSLKTRNLSDVDVLVKEEDLPKAILICKNNGFDTKIWEDYLPKKHTIYSNPNLVHSNKLAQLDIHTTVFRDNEKANELFFKNILLDKNKIILNNEILLLHLIYHGTTKDSFNVGPIFIMDLIFLINKHKIDWPYVLKLAEELSMEYELSLVLSYLIKTNILPKSFTRYVINNYRVVEDLDKIFLSIPSRSNLDKVAGESSILKKLFFLLKIFFSKEFILEHSNQKLSIRKVLKKTTTLFRRYAQTFFSLTFKKDNIARQKINLSRNFKNFISEPKR